MHSSDRCSSSFNLPPGKSHPVSKDRFKIKLFTLTQVMDVGNQPLHSAPPKICPKYSDKTYMYFLLTQLQRLVPSDGSLTFRPRPLHPPPHSCLDHKHLELHCLSKGDFEAKTLANTSNILNQPFPSACSNCCWNVCLLCQNWFKQTPDCSVPTGV